MTKETKEQLAKRLVGEAVAEEAARNKQPMAWAIRYAGDSNKAPLAQVTMSEEFAGMMKHQGHEVIALGPITHPAPDALRIALPDPLFIDTVQRMLARFDRAKGKGGYPTANERWAMRECVATLVALQANQKGGA